jgi:hypothetical protein
MGSRRDPETGLVRRGTSNSNQRGSAESRRRRKEWMLEEWAADVEVQVWWKDGEVIDVTPVDPATGKTEPPEWATFGRLDPGYDAITRQPATRCYRCGCLLVFQTLTVDRIVPHCKGGTYRRNNIRPACLKHNSETGGGLANGKVHAAAKKRAAKKRALVAIPSRDQRTA